MDVLNFPVPQSDAADRIMSRLDLGNLSEAEFVGFVNEAGFTETKVGSSLSVREQLAFVINNIGEAETFTRLMELVGESANHEAAPAEIEFQVRLTDSLWLHEARTGRDPLPAELRRVAFGEITSLCAHCGIEVVPCVTAGGELLLQWRDDGADRVARVWEQDGRLRLLYETASDARECVYSLPVLRSLLVD